VSPAFQLGTALDNVGGSAGRPSGVSSLNRNPAIQSSLPLSVGAERQGERTAGEPGAIRGVEVARKSASDRATIAGSAATGAATQAGRLPAERRARRGDGSAGSAAEAGSDPLATSKL
jgi:hypothetical protein